MENSLIPNIPITGVGIDLVTVSRFNKFVQDKNHPFLVKVFSSVELEYCFSYENPDVHLAGHFALKEAVSKALGTSKYPFVEVEVRHGKEGEPEVWHKGIKLSVKVSISHTEEYACAIAVA